EEAQPDVVERGVVGEDDDRDQVRGDQRAEQQSLAAGAAAALGGPAALEGAPGQAAAAPGAGRRRALGVGGVPVRRLGASWGTEGAAETDAGGGREGRRGAMSAAGPGRRRAHRKNTSICRATCTDTR